MISVNIVRCPRCGADFEVSEHQWNRKISCPYCGTFLRPSCKDEFPEIWLKNTLSTSQAQNHFFRFLKNKVSKISLISDKLYFIPFYLLEGIYLHLSFNKKKKNLDLAPVRDIIPAARPATFPLPSSLKLFSGKSLYGYGTLKPHMTTPPAEGRLISPSLPPPDPEHHFLKETRTTSSTLLRAGIDIRLSLLYYPFRILEYRYCGARYFFLFDGTDGNILYGTLPGRFHYPPALASATALLTGLLPAFIVHLTASTLLHTGLLNSLSFYFILAILAIFAGKGYVKILKFLPRYIHETGVLYTDGKEIYETPL